MYIDYLTKNYKLSRDRKMDAPAPAHDVSEKFQVFSNQVYRDVLTAYLEDFQVSLGMQTRRLHNELAN